MQNLIVNFTLLDVLLIHYKLPVNLMIPTAGRD
jgi:hypothetical protein